MRIERRAPVASRGRAASYQLTRERIVETAVRLMRAEGLDRVTMRRLAQELETGPASLYAHVRNAAELHGAILDHLLAGLDMSPGAEGGAGGGDWRERLIGLLSEYTVLLFRQPALARSVLALRPSGPNYLRLIDAILRLLDDGDVPLRQAAWGVDILLQLATATAAEQGTRDETADADTEIAALVTALDASLPDTYPAIARVGRALFEGTPEQHLDWLFRAAIAGIAVTPPPHPPPTA